MSSNAHPPGAVISVESLPEYTVSYINLDGSEVYEKPPTASEAFCRMLEQLDFSKWSDDGSDLETTEGKTKFNAVVASSDSTVNGKGWSSVRQSVHSALTETCVLLDLLSVVRDKPHYMSLEPIFNEPEKLENRHFILLQNKKRAAQTASEILKKGLDSLRESSFASNLHDLQKLRKFWRLRRLGTSGGVGGDLSLRSAGSTTPEVAGFELRTTQNKCSIILPGHLYGEGRVNLTMSAPRNAPLVSHDFNKKQLFGNVQVSLFNSQQLLFQHELINWLSREALQMGCRACQQVFTCNIFPGQELCVELVKCVGEEQVSQSTSSQKRFPKANHLTNIIQCLMAKQYKRSLTEKGPFPVTAPAGVSDERRSAGPDAKTYLPVTSRSLLDTFLCICRHNLLVSELSAFLISWNHSEVYLVTHWNSSISNRCQIFIDIVKHGQELAHRVRLTCVCDDQQVVLWTRSGFQLVASFGDISSVFTPFFNLEAYNHIIFCLNGCVKSLGWHNIASNTDPPSVMYRSPDGMYICCVHLSNQTRRMTLKVSETEEPARWVEVDLHRVRGCNDFDRVESVIAALTKIYK